MEEKDKLKELDRDIKVLNQHLELLEREIEHLRERKQPHKLGLDDIFQELAGAVAVAFTMALSEEIWELAQRLNWFHILGIFLFILLVANFFVRYGNRKQWASQVVLGFIQLRLLTTAVLALIVSAFAVVLLGVYPNMVDNFSDYLKVVLFVASFSIIGGLGLDMAKE
jgi:uncharacterized membrane protein